MESRQKLIFPVLLFLCNAVFAQSASGIRFVAIPFAPEAVAWTEASAAFGGYEYSAYANPAKTAFAPSGQASIVQNIWPDVQSTSFLGSTIQGNGVTWGFSLLSNLVDDLEARTTPGTPDGLFSARYTAVTGSLSKKFGNVAVGASGSYLNESIYEANASGWSFSAGIAAHFLEKRLFVGSSLLHAGEMNPLRSIESELPMRWQTGVWVDAIQFSEKETGFTSILISLKSDLIVPLDAPEGNVWPGQTSPWITFGSEFQIDERFFIRNGWRSDDTTRPWSAGAGVKIGTWRIDYALTRQQSGFGTIHTLGATLTF